VPIVSNESFTLWASNRLDTSNLKDVLDDPRYPGMEAYSVYGRAFPGIEAKARRDGFDFAHASEARRDRWFRTLVVDDIKARPGRGGVARRPGHPSAVRALPGRRGRPDLRAGDQLAVGVVGAEARRPVGARAGVGRAREPVEEDRPAQGADRAVLAEPCQLGM